MMREINDNLFQQAVSCPLKLFHYLQSGSVRYSELPFRHRNKLHLRDAVSLRYENRRFTSDDTQSALAETELWLREDTIAICGAVLKSGSFITRIPILLKEGDRLTVVQVHGKLRNRSQARQIDSVPKNRQSAIYLLKAAFRVQVLQQLFPGCKPEVRLFFPDRTYRCGTGSFYDLMQNVRSIDPGVELVEECNKLFAEVDATRGTEELMLSMPDNVAHRYFAGRTTEEICTLLIDTDWGSGNILNVRIHNGCKYCDFRKGGGSDGKGCWDRFFFDEEIAEPGRHVFELIGHGNDEESEKGFHFQEQVPFTDQFSSFELLKKSGQQTISIHQRRILQILSSRDDDVPQMWVKPGLKMIEGLRFPLHFIDFEAATSALPMERGIGPYNPVLFQFSCHTLQDDGSLTHHEWLDDTGAGEFPHPAFIGKLAEVPGIFEGTLIQYSQFEYRGLKDLLSGFRRNSMLYEAEINSVKNLMDGNSGHEIPRFVDLSRLISDFYFNDKLGGGLGLKQVLKSVLLKISKEGDAGILEAQIHDTRINLLNFALDGSEPDPYSLIGDEELKMNIDDGAVAMNAYIAMKSGLLTSDEKEKIPVLLKRYCALDTFALYVIYRHLVKYASQIGDEEDLVFF
jgi:hypothetical protein